MVERREKESNIMANLTLKVRSFPGLREGRRTFIMVGKDTNRARKGIYGGKQRRRKQSS